MYTNANSSTRTLPYPILSSFLRSLKADGRRPRTYEHYVSSAELWLDWAKDEGVEPYKARRGEIQSFVVWMQEEKGWTAATVNNRFRGVRAFYDWLLAEEEIVASPFGPPRARTLTAPEVEETSKDIATIEQMTKLLAHLEKHKRWRDCAVVGALYDTGMRRGELAGLMTDHLDMETGYATLEAATTKGKRMRIVHFSPRVLRYIDRYWRKDGEKGGRKDTRYVLNGTRGALTGSGIYRLVRRCFMEIKVEAMIGPHDLRHTSASHVATDGEMSESSMMQLYGWRSAEMVRRYSAQVRQAAALKAHERFSPMERLNGRKKED